MGRPRDGAHYSDRPLADDSMPHGLTCGTSHADPWRARHTLLAASNDTDPGDDGLNPFKAGARQLTLANALRLLTGLWVMEAPFVYAPLDANAAAIWNNLIVGGCVV